MNLKSIIKYLIFLGLGVLILWLMWRSQSAGYLEQCAKDGIAAEDCSLFDRIIDDFKSVKWIWIIFVLGIYMLSNYFRTVRWNQLLNSLGHRPKFLNSFATLMLGYFSNLGVPRSGEFIRAGTLSRYEKIPFEQTFATVVVGRIVDVIMLLVVIGIAFLLSWDIFVSYFEQNFKIPASTIFTYFGILVVLGVVGLLFLRFLLKMPGEKMSGPIKKLKEIISKFIEGLSSITKVENKWMFVFYSVGIWVCYFFMTYCCFFAFEPTNHLSPIAALVVFVFGTLGIVFPSPGGLGSYHFLVKQALIILGLSQLNAFSFAMILFFSVQLFGNILFGLISLVMLPLINRAK